MKSVRCGDPEMKPPQCVERWDGKDSTKSAETQTGLQNKTGTDDANKITQPAPSGPEIKLPTEPAITLNVVSVNAEAWWKSCLMAEVIGSGAPPIEIGCNKSKGQIGKSVSIPANKTGCNELRFSVKTYDTKGECSADGDCGENAPDIQNWTRTTEIPNQKQFFKMFPADKLKAPFGDIQMKPEEVDKIPQLNADAVKYQEGKNAKWFRVFFEDQKDTNYNAWLHDKASWAKYGIDFNDYTFDIKSGNLLIGLEGTPWSCSVVK